MRPLEEIVGDEVTTGVWDSSYNNNYVIREGDNILVLGGQHVHLINLVEGQFSVIGKGSDQI
jgi:hypothetical protein